MYYIYVRRRSKVLLGSYASYQAARGGLGSFIKQCDRLSAVLGFEPNEPLHVAVAHHAAGRRVLNRFTYRFHNNDLSITIEVDKEYFESLLHQQLDLPTTFRGSRAQLIQKLLLNYDWLLKLEGTYLPIQDRPGAVESDMLDEWHSNLAEEVGF